MREKGGDEGRRRRLLQALALLPLAVPVPSFAAPPTLRVAVAANFLATAKEIAEAFTAKTGIPVEFTSGSTGMLTAQILQGAPYDVIMAADRESVQSLAAAGRIVADSAFTYAYGRLVLWSTRPGYVDENGEILTKGTFRHLAIANPKLAPYGRAAQETIAALGLTEALAPRIVQGASVGQAYEFVASGNAELGFVALSQMGRDRRIERGSAWIVPARFHQPIAQDAAMVSGTRNPEAAREWLELLRLGPARTILYAWGYRLT
jgi:molybdate transport system substrate-binding protein